MIDNFTLLLTHGLIVLALWRMLSRADLDADGAEEKPRRKAWARRHNRGAGTGQEGGTDA